MICLKAEADIARSERIGQTRQLNAVYVIPKRKITLSVELSRAEFREFIVPVNYSSK